MAAVVHLQRDRALNGRWDDRAVFDREGGVENVAHSVEDAVERDVVRRLCLKTFEVCVRDVGTCALDVAEDWSGERVAQLKCT